jgi:hypothetical protein
MAGRFPVTIQQEAGVIPALKPVTTQTVSISGTSAATSNAVGSNTTVVRIISDTACHYVIGASPTATTSSPYLPANVFEYVRVTPGVDKVAFIQSASSGSAYVSECA